MTPASDSLASLFLASARRWPDRPAVSFAEGDISYAALAERASSLAATLRQGDLGTDTPLVAVLARHSTTAYAAILGSLFCGAAYVPLDAAGAADRNRAILARTGCRTIVADTEGLAALPALLDGSTGAMRVLLPDVADTAAASAALPGHQVLGAADLAAPDGVPPAEVGPDDMAYLLFTSGSTGVPKGVMVSQANACHLVRMSGERWDVAPEDRFSHNFALTFDLSVFDLFVAWSRGACLCCPTAKELLNPAGYVQREALTIWFSVPSVGVMMARLKRLTPGAFPTLRTSLFCGEALPAAIADAWSRAAPNGPVENLYGPTEATVFCTAYRWDADASPAESERGVVPIGAALPGVETLVVDDDLAPMPDGEVGELLLGGVQVALGYWQDPALTARAFVTPPGRTGRFYRTGDRVRSSADGPLQFVGRTDHQLKIRGHRVELGEIEAALRRVAGVEHVVALPLGVTDVGAEHVGAFVAGTDADIPAIRAELGTLLPSYMVPRQIFALPEFPLNANGKVDRGALAALMESRVAAARGR